VNQARSSLLSRKSQQIVIWLGDGKGMVRDSLRGESLNPSWSTITIVPGRPVYCRAADRLPVADQTETTMKAISATAAGSGL
jgi:hypothetical protein